MTIKDWIDLGITVASYLLVLVAGIYAKEKGKINKATKAGQVMDLVGKLATNAVHEAEYSGMDNDAKREFASEMVTQGLKTFGIKNVTANQINGSIERAVNAMHIANSDMDSDIEEVKANVPESDILKPDEVGDENGN